MKTITDQLNRKIYIIDNALSQTAHEHLYYFVRSSFFKIGFSDTDALERSAHQYLMSSYSMEDLETSGFLKELKKTEIWDIIKDKHISRMSVNLSVPSDTNFAHTHKNCYSLLYYINLDWKPEWAGETLFYSDDLKNIEYASVYTPKRLILFDGEIPHSIRVQSNSSPHYRFTLALFIEKNT